MQEVWKPIPGFDGYEASSTGLIGSWKRPNQHLPKRTERYLMKMSFDSDGYLKVTLTQNKKEYTKTVHRLVALAFLGARPKGCEVCHNDGIRTNNMAENLRYDTRKGNANDMEKHGTLRVGEKNPNAKLSEADIRAIRSDTRPYKEISAQYGILCGSVSNIKLRRSWSWLI